MRFAILGELAATTLEVIATLLWAPPAKNSALEGRAAGVLYGFTIGTWSMSGAAHVHS